TSSPRWNGSCCATATSTVAGALAMPHRTPARSDCHSDKSDSVESAESVVKKGGADPVETRRFREVMYSSEWFETFAGTVPPAIIAAELDGIAAALPPGRPDRLLDVRC